MVVIEKIELIDFFAHPPVRQDFVDFLNGQCNTGHGTGHRELFIYFLITIFKVACYSRTHHDA